MTENKTIKLNTVLTTVFRSVVIILFTVFTGYLTLLSMYTTHYSFVGKEWYVSDSPIKFVGGFVLLVIGMALALRIWKRICNHWGLLFITRRRVAITFLIITGAFLLWYIISTQIIPVGDQRMICDAASALKSYDTYLFSKGNYFDYYPFQARVSVFLWMFFNVFGDNNYVAVQLLNGVCLLGIFFLLGLIWKEADLSRQDEGDEAIICSCLFVPALLYVTYIYGNLPGLLCMLAAVYELIKYRKNHGTRELVAIIVFNALGIGLKSTYMIIMVAIIVFLALDVVENNWKYLIKNLTGILLVLVAVSLMNGLLDTVVEKRLDIKLSEGTPMVSWIAMATSEDEAGKPVMYNAYNVNVYKDNNCDTSLAQKESLELIKSNVASLTDSPLHLISFLGKKMAVEWSEPTHQALVASNQCTYNTVLPERIKNLLRQDNTNPVVKLSNLLQTCIYMGSFWWIILRRKKINNSQLILPVIFIGGFIFQLFWETQSQYTLTYVLLLIPLSVAGFRECAKWIGIHITKRVNGANSWLRMIPYGILLIGIVAFVGLSPDPVTKALFRTDEDTIAYTEYLAESLEKESELQAAIEDGVYQLTNEATGATIKVTIFHNYGFDLIRRHEDGLLLSLDGDPAAGSVDICWDGDYYLWKIKPVEAGGYKIYYGDCVLTDQGELVLESDSMESKAVWKIQ